MAVTLTTCMTLGLAGQAYALPSAGGDASGPPSASANNPAPTATGSAAGTDSPAGTSSPAGPDGTTSPSSAPDTGNASDTGSAPGTSNAPDTGNAPDTSNAPDTGSAPGASNPADSADSAGPDGASATGNDPGAGTSATPDSSTGTDGTAGPHSAAGTHRIPGPSSSAGDHSATGNHSTTGEHSATGASSPARTGATAGADSTGKKPKGLADNAHRPTTGASPTGSTSASGGGSASASTRGNAKEPAHFGRFLPWATTAANGAEGTASILSTPTAPGSVTATADASTRIVVTWTPDLVNGNHYVATSSPDGATCSAMAQADTTCTITGGLIAGTPYTVSVVDYDSFGAPSLPGTSGTVTTGAPDAPTVPTATVTGSGQVTVAWTAEAPNGGIAKYTVSSTPPSGGCMTADSSSTTCDVTGLTPSTAYTFTVMANGAGSVGDSGSSSATSSVTPNPPGQPTSVAGTASSAHTVHVTWTAPGSTGLGIDHYTVSSTPPSAGCTTANGTTRTCDIAGLTAGTSYTFTVVANGTSGSGNSAASTASSSVTPGPPGAPTSVGGTASAGTTVHVSWTAPGIAGNGIDHYTVSSTPPSGGCTTANGGTTSCDVSGLTAGTSYTFTVVANGTGSSGTSAASTASSPVVPGPPGPPTAVAGTASDADTVTVTWLAPGVTGNGINHYTVSSIPPSGGCSTADAVTLTCDVDSLTPGTAYTFTVVANGTGSSGDSAASTASAPVTPGPPDAPTTVTATAGNLSAVVSWTAPTNPGNGIDHYTVSSVPASAGCTATGATTCPVSGLTSGTSYTFSVVANGTGSSGDSASSAPSAAVIPGPPGAPTAVAGTASAGNTVHVSWTAPSIVGNGIAHYTVTSIPASAGCTTSDGSTTTCDVAVLTAGTSYTFTVVANGVSGTGDSAASTPSGAVVPGPPGAPTAVTVTPGDTQLAVTWTAPANPGNGISHYTATATPGSHTCDSTGTATACTLSGLTNGTSYSVTVKSVGAGSSGTSSDSTAASGTPSIAPGAPTGAAAEAGIESATVAWSAPTSTGSGILHYVATATPGGRSCTTTDATTTTCTITGLTAGIGYTVAVVAKGTYGADSAASTATSSVTPTAPVPATVPATVPSSDGPVGSSGGDTLTAEQSVTLTGSGYKANSTITVAIYSSPTVLGTTTTDGTGSFSMQVTLPSGVSGSHTLVAAGLAPDNSVRYTTLPVTVAASGSGGGNLAVTGAPSMRIALVGAALVLLGMALVTRRRRVKPVKYDLV